MKKHLLLQRSFLILAFVSLLGLQNCQKESIHRETTGTTAIFPVTERESDPLSEQAYNENVTDYYEEQGKFIYNHFRYRFATVAPEEYIGSDSREAFMQSMQEQKEISADKTYPQILDEYFTEGILTENEQALMLDLHNLIVAQENEDLTFGQAWYLIREWEIHTQNDQAISEDEKELVLMQASALRNVMKYAYENGEIVEDRGKDCFLGRKLSCWWDKIGKSALDAIKAGLTILVGGGEFEFKDIKKAAFKAGGISLVINVISIFLDPACRCSEDPPSGTACEKAKGISIFPGGCNTLEQTFRAWGYSAPPGTVFEWIVQNGTFPDNNNSTSITTISPEVKVRQNDPNVPINLGVRLSCIPSEEGFTIVEAISIPALVNDTGTLIIWGQKELYPSSTYHYKYEFWGSWLNNQNSVIIYSGCSPHGQVVESGIDYVKIQWNSTQPSYPTPKVTAIVKNLCSGLTVTENLDIIIH